MSCNLLWKSSCGCYGSSILFYTSESRRKNLNEAYGLCIQVERQIRRGSYRNQNCEEILRLYTDIAVDLRNKNVKAEVEAFCNVSVMFIFFSELCMRCMALSPQSHEQLKCKVGSFERLCNFRTSTSRVSCIFRLI